MATYNFDNAPPELIKFLKSQARKKPEDRNPEYIDAVNSYVSWDRSKQSEKTEKSIEEKGKLNPLTSIPLTVLKGGTLASSDELVGKFSPELAEKMNRQTDLMRERYPKINFMLETGGGIGLGLLSSPIMARTALTRFLAGQGAKSNIGKIAAPTVPGGLTGGTYGYFEGETPTERKEGAIYGGGLGAVGGPLVTGAGKGIMATGRYIGDNITGYQGGESRAIKDALQSIIEDVGGGEVAKQNIREGTPLLYQPGLVGGEIAEDITEGSGRGKVGYDVRPLVEGEDTAKNIILRDLGNPRDEMTKTFDDLLQEFDDSVKFDDIKVDDFKTYTKFADSITNKIKVKADSEYKAAQLQADVDVDVYNAVKDVLNDFRIGNMGKKIKEGLESVSDRNTLEKILRFNPDGGVDIIPENLTLAEVEQIRRIFQTYIDSAPDVIRIKNDKQLALRELLDNKYPELTTARGTYNRASEIDDAYQKSKKLYTGSKYQEFVDAFDDALNNSQSASEKEIRDSFRRGALVQIYRRYDEAKDKVNFIRKLNDSSSAEYKMLKEIYPNENINDLIKKVDDLENRFKTKSAFLSNSSTAERIKKSKFRPNLEKYVGSFGNIFDDFFSGEKLSSDEKIRIAEIVIDKNPDIIDRILDPKYRTFFARQIAPEIAGVTSGVGVGSSEVDEKIF